MIPLLSVPWSPGTWAWLASLASLPLLWAPGAAPAVPAPASGAEAAAPALIAELAAREAARALPPPAVAMPQGTLVYDRPRFFVAIGGNVVDGDVRSPAGDDPDYDNGLSLDVGFYSWNDSLGLALELGYLPSSYEIDVSSLSSDDVDVRRYLLGLRFTDDESDSFFLYHLRGGAVLREDSGDVIDDDGWGWYLGGGIEWKLGGGFSLGPSVLYSETDSLDSNEWIFGLQAAYAF